jgi:hypothetical protein
MELQPLSSELLLCGELNSNAPQPIPCRATIALEYRDGKSSVSGKAAIDSAICV